ncbi:MAG: SBBP repeat-containing protein, partial [Flavobacteriales bacterium]|nr:SBBP repeat-containing protein [Flavobacteriales bacterium]
MGFQENKGQMVGVNNLSVDEVLFKAESPGLNIWVTTSGLTYQFFTKNNTLLTNSDGSPMMGKDGKQKKNKNIRWHRQDMVLKNASIRKENIETEGDISQGDVRYFLGHCPDGIFNVKTYTKVIISDVYPGIDWKLYTSVSGGLKHEFIVHPGANPGDVKMVYEGSGQIDVGENELKFSNELGNLIEGQLLCYQGNSEHPISSKYNATKNKNLLYSGFGVTRSPTILNDEKPLYSYNVTISIGDYDKTQDLIIDPELVWGTMYGGNATDGFSGVDTDSNGNVFIAGYAGSTNFPTQDAGTYYQGAPAGGWYDVMILKFDNNGNRIWVTFYGGSEGESGFSLSVDINDNIWITGTVGSFDFPTQDAGTFFNGTKQHTSPNIYDIFVLKFDNAGNRLWATYYGGYWDDYFPRITTDINGNAWITGYAQEYFPTLNGGGYSQGVISGYLDAFLVKFDNSCNLLHSTYFGGSGRERGQGITSDINGNIWITGSTSSTDFPTLDAGTFFQASNGGGDSDAFIAKFDNAGNQLMATYYGGSAMDDSYSVATDLNGKLWVLGGTSSTDFPTQDAGTFFQSANNGGGLWYAHDAFILKFDDLGNREWATYYGGSEHDAYEAQFETNNVAIDECGNAYISFATKSNDILTYDPGTCHFYEGTYGGELNDIFIAKFDKDANLLWGSYIGGNKRDFRCPLAVDNNNNLFMAGEFTDYLSSSTLPLVNPGGSTYYNDSPGGMDDSFIFKFIQPAITVTQSQVNLTSCVCVGSATVNISNCGIPPYSYVWSNGTQTIDTAGTTNTISGLCT